MKVFVGVVVLAVVAAIAIPNLMGPKVNWNDTAALATLRNLASVQRDFQAKAIIDIDGDGVGEYGTLGEMTGSGGVRRDAAARERGAKLSPPLLSPALAGVGSEGIAIKSSYCIRILLPAPGMVPTRERSPDEPFHAPVDVEGTEQRWCAYAWPSKEWGEHKGSSRLFHFRVFFVTETGDVWQTMNQDKRYVGSSGGPAWDAAMPASGTGWAPANPKVDEYRGRDGNVWKRTN